MTNRMIKGEVIFKDLALKGACVVLRAEDAISGGYIKRSYKYS